MALLAERLISLRRLRGHDGAGKAGTASGAEKTGAGVRRDGNRARNREIKFFTSGILVVQYLKPTDVTGADMKDHTVAAQSLLLIPLALPTFGEG